MKKCKVLFLCVLFICGCTSLNSETKSTPDSAKKGDDKSDKAKVSSIDDAFYFIARDYYYGIVKLAEEFKEFSEYEIVETKNYSVFHIIYANMEQNIRGMGGNGPVYVFRENNNQYELVYHNASDEMVNRVKIIEDSDCLKLLTYAHIGLTAGPAEPIIYKWHDNKFEYYK